MLRRTFLEKTGLSLPALRHYEKRGLLRPHRLPGQKFGRYDETHVERVKEIAALQTLGLGLSKIREFQQATPDRKHAILKEGIEQGIAGLKDTQGALQQAFVWLMQLHTPTQ